VRGLRVTSVFVCAAALALTAACGEIRKPKGSGSGAMAAAGKSGAGGSTGVSGGAAMGSADSGEGGMAPEGGGGIAGRGGAPTAGFAGASLAGGTGVSGAMSAMAGSAAGGATGVVVPDGCELVSEHGAGLYCSAELTCDGERVIVSCTAEDSGAWSCSCVDGETSSLFEFPETAGTPTCSMTAKVCRHPELLTGEEKCTLDDKADGLTCVATDTCRREHELDGVKLTTKTEWKASCDFIDGTSLIACSCSDQAKIDYWLSQTGSSTSCRFLDPLCRGAAPTPKTDWDCTTDFEESGPGYGCHSGKTCLETVTLEDGTDLTLRQGYNLNCRTIGGHTRCACEDTWSEEKLTLSLGISADDIGACQVTIDACAGLEKLELADTPECTTTTDETTAGSCERVLECTQQGVTARTQVTALTRVGASCARHENGSWFCNCKSLSGLQEGVELEAADSASACDAAIDQCPRFAPGLD
jgi:hypothetical protein